mgnify:CR=1 FL=1
MLGLEAARQGCKEELQGRIAGYVGARRGCLGGLKEGQGGIRGREGRGGEKASQGSGLVGGGAA